MRVFLTGATGFLGGKLAEQLRAQGHEVVALVRNPAKAKTLESLGVELAPGDITEPQSLPKPLEGAGAAIHVAAWYELGVEDIRKMREINVQGTRNVLEAAAKAGVPRIVHCSSVAALGTTGGKLADETHRHQGPFGSAYEETKHEAHELALGLAKAGAPVSIALPGTIFGPGDSSLVHYLIEAHLRRVLVASAFPKLYMSLVFVDDCARGLWAIAQKGKPGREYNLVGETIRMGDWITRMSELTGIAPPRVSIPVPLIRAGARLFPLVAGAVGVAPGTVRDGLAMADNAAWRYSAERARRELGWEPTEFSKALAVTLLAFDRRRGAGFRPRTPEARQALEWARGERRAA